jgi:eukaryotic-like serine/threonine-protein kinase
MTKLKICPTCGASYDAAHLFCPRDSAPLRSADDTGELVGSLIAGRYLVSARIGVGGMGEVYRAQDVRLQRPVAIKVLHASLSGDLDALARFSREAANCSKMNSQHVVQVYDFGETGGLAYLAMEYVEGKSLKAVIDSEGPLPPERVARMVAQIARGLDAAHRLDCPVIHRDLKPENVLVAADPEGGELLKVADFGISKALRDDTQQVTRTGFVTGTYEYMSPEQVCAGVVDQRSDVYSLGLIAFQLLTGKLPFPAQTPEHSMLLRLTDAPQTLRAMNPSADYPDQLQRVLDKALARDPADRFASAGELGRDLTRSIQAELNHPAGLTYQSALRHQPESTQPPAVTRRSEPPRRAVQPARKRRGLWAAIVLLAAAAGLGVFFANRHGPRETAFAGETDSLLTLNPEPALNERASAIDSNSPRSPAATISSYQPPAGAALDTVAPRRETTAVPHPLKKPAPPKPPARKPVTPATPPVGLDQGHTALESYESILQPDMPRDSALAALLSLDALLPRLTSTRDSVEADIYRAEATALGGKPNEACAILKQARPRATDRQREKMDLWADQGICPP